MAIEKIGTQLSMSQKQLFAVKTIEKQQYVGLDDNLEMFLTGDINKAQLLDGTELVDFVLDAEEDIEEEFIVEYIGYENILDGIGRDC